jgi:hypothetical protein
MAIDKEKIDGTLDNVEGWVVHAREIGTKASGTENGV